jgi:hypothetical protein
MVAVLRELHLATNTKIYYFINIYMRNVAIIELKATLYSPSILLYMII